MRRAVLLGLLAGFAALLGACGGTEDRRPVAAAASTQVSIVSAATTSSPDTNLNTLEPVRADLDEIPISEPVDWGCWQFTLADVAWAPIVFDGRIVEVGEPGELTVSWATIVGRMVRFEVSADVVGASELTSADGTIDIFWPEQYVGDGYRWATAGPDLSTARQLASVLVFGSADGSLPQVAGIASQTSNGVSLNGKCAHLEPVADEVAPRLGYQDALDMFRHTSIARAAGDDLSDLTDETLAYWEREEERLRPTWDELDPETRVLGPGTIAADQLDRLDVAGVSYELDDLGAFGIVGVRTPSGVSEPLIGSSALPSLGPLYWLTGVDDVVEVFVTSDPSGAATVVPIASVAVADVERAGGLRVTGSVQAGTVAVVVISRVELATLLNTDEAGLDALRQTYLTPPG